MNNNFATYEQAVTLKRLGFDAICLGQWNWSPHTKSYYLSDEWLPHTGNIISAPLKSQVFKWFREKHNLHHNIQYSGKDYIAYTHYVDGMTKYSYPTYEQAEDACIDKLIELIKK